MSARKFTDVAAITAIRNKRNLSIAAVLRELNCFSFSGSNYQLIRRIVQQHNLDISHWLGQKQNTLLKGIFVKSREDFFTEHSTSRSHSVRLRLFLEGLKQKKCELCGCSQWLGQPIPLEVDHINGKRRDNRLENLRILCPNCHAMTPTYKTKNHKALWVKSELPQPRDLKPRPLRVEVPPEPPI